MTFDTKFWRPFKNRDAHFVAVQGVFSKDLKPMPLLGGSPHFSIFTTLRLIYIQNEINLKMMKDLNSGT